MQKHLSDINTLSLLGGGLGVELLAHKYLQNIDFRLHSDIDLYIPISSRGKVLDSLKSLGHIISSRSYKTSDIVTSTNTQEIPFNFISIDGIGAQSFVLQMSIVGEEIQFRNRNLGYRPPYFSRRIYISTQPESVYYNQENFLLLNTTSQFEILNRFSSNDKKRARDLQLVSEILQRTS